MAKKDETSECFIDGATGVFHQYAPNVPKIPICMISAVKLANGNAGIDLIVNPAILAEKHLAVAFLQDARAILDRIEERYVKGVER